jgi:hypothetical protein
VIAALVAAAIAGAPPQTVLTIDPKHRLVEGVASDGTTIWVSSILDREILACRATCRTIATLPAPLHPFGLAWDWGRKILWVAADCPPGVPAIKPCSRGAVIGLSPRGEVRYRFVAKAPSFHPGDVSATQSGIFASDSQNGMVWGLLSGRRGQLRPINRPGDGKSAQGTALAASGTEVIVADYSRGIGKIDLKTAATTWLPRQDGKPLRGVDGLTRCASVYYGIYNGQSPGALVSISPGKDGLTFGQPLGSSLLPDPTQIANDGKRLLIVADSGWATLDKPGFVRTQGAPIVAVPLSRDCKPL